MRLLLFFALMALPVNAQVVRVMIPLGTEETTPGGYGSLWKAELRVHNASNQAAAIEACGNLFPGAQGILPKQTAPYRVYAARGEFACIQGVSLADLGFSLRIRDLSRQALSWGTEIPVVTENDVFTSTLSLVHVPTDSRFRAALRIYDFNGHFGERFRLQAFDPEGNAVLDTTVQQPEPPWGASHPGYIAIIDLVATYPSLKDHEHVTLHVSARSPLVQFWAFVAVTNNEAQHVTTVTPRR